MILLAELRKNRGLTQKQLSEVLGISESSIAMYEAGYRIPSLNRAKKIAKFFNVPVEEIFFGDVTHVLRAKTNISYESNKKY